MIYKDVTKVLAVCLTWKCKSPSSMNIIRMRNSLGLSSTLRENDFFLKRKKKRKQAVDVTQGSVYFCSQCISTFPALPSILLTMHLNNVIKLSVERHSNGSKLQMSSQSPVFAEWNCRTMPRSLALFCLLLEQMQWDL